MPQVISKLPHNPWINMWFHPKQTIREIVDTNPRHRFIVLSALYGWMICLYYAQALSLGVSYQLWQILVGSLVLCIPFGAISILFTTLLIYLTGKIIRGQATFIEVRAAVSWSNVTSILNVLITLVLVTMFQELLFIQGISTGPTTDGISQFIFLIMIAEIAISVWRLILIIGSVSEVQRFSLWMGFLNLLFVFIVLLILNYLGQRILMVTSNSSTLSFISHLFISP